MSDSSLTTERFANARRADVIQPGDVIANKYLVRTVLGRERGLLLDATHTETDHRVVIKLLPAGHGDDKEVERFRREGRALAKLQSEHVARIIDVGSQADGSFYLVRQHLEGIDLAQYLRQSGPLPLAHAVLLIAQAAEAVAEAHGHGVILRELAPTHLFMTQRAGGAPVLKVVDFGTAKPKHGAGPEAGGELTATAMFGISPYASPELVRKAKNLDFRMDVWSLGAIFYEMLAGRPPFNGELAMLMLQITKEDLMPLSSFRSDLPPEIDQIIGWAMAKDVDGRFRNVHAFMHALLPYAPVEAQMLIERIGHITRAARTRRQGEGAELAARQPPVVIAPAVMPAPAAPPPMPAMSQAPAVLPPPAMPAILPPPAMPPMAAVSQAPAVNEGNAPVAAESSAAPAAPRADEVVAAAAAPPPAVKAAQPKREWSSFANGLAFMSGAIPVLLGVLILAAGLPAKGGAKTASAEQTRDAVEATAAPAGEAGSSATAHKEGSPSSSDSDDAASHAKATPMHSKAKASKRTVAARKASKADSGQELPEMEDASSDDAPSAGGGTGTLFAVATGGNCAFSVNGASKGTSASVKLALPAGTYSVACKRASGEAISKSVTVKEGQAAFATFKSQEST
jgi:eukaryotic-like serine/threonine-protein kinase